MERHTGLRWSAARHLDDLGLGGVGLLEARTAQRSATAWRADVGAQAARPGPRSSHLSFRLFRRDRECQDLLSWAVVVLTQQRLKHDTQARAAVAQAPLVGRGWAAGEPGDQAAASAHWEWS